jgi:hypothetical protein
MARINLPALAVCVIQIITFLAFGKYFISNPNGYKALNDSIFTGKYLP